jgi:hypothetical protein
LRARADDRLTAGHFRLLLTIAWHDRFSEQHNSAGCFASQSTLAKETKIHPTNVGGYAADLADRGYIRIERHPKDRRRYVYRVIYDAPTVGQPTNFRRAPQPPCPQIPGKILGEQTNQIVGEAPSQDVDREWKSAAEYIPLRDIKIKGSLNGLGRDAAKRERDLAEAPASNGCELHHRMQWGEQLDRVQRVTGLSREKASEVLMAAGEASYYPDLADPATSDDRIVEILRNLRQLEQQ